MAQAAGKLGKARVVTLLSDITGAGILALGPRFGVPARFVDPAPFKTKLEGQGRGPLHRRDATPYSMPRCNSFTLVTKMSSPTSWILPPSLSVRMRQPSQSFSARPSSNDTMGY